MHYWQARQRSNSRSLQDKYPWRRAAPSHVTAFQPAVSRRVNAFASSWTVLLTN